MLGIVLFVLACISYGCRTNAVSEHIQSISQKSPQSLSKMDFAASFGHPFRKSQSQSVNKLVMLLMTLYPGAAWDVFVRPVFSPDFAAFKFRRHSFLGSLHAPQGSLSLRKPLLSPTVSMQVAHVPVPFTPAFAHTVKEIDARWALENLQCVPVDVPGIGSIQTTFYRPASKNAGPPVLFLHGGDSTCLEWRFVIRRLLKSSDLDCIAVDWWTGGWTSREEITAALHADSSRRPWDCIREHLYAFWQQQLGGKAVHLVGTSMGGAVAIDFAATHPEAVSKLMLVDAGGESYAAPPPHVGSFLAPFCPVLLRAQAWLQPKLGEAAALGNLHRNSPGWIPAYVAYLTSGGYELRVGPERIRMVSQPTKVLWGEDDPVLDPGDASKFEADLQRCEGVVTIPGGGHCPQLFRIDDVVRELLRWSR